ncbi:NnrS family protein [Natronospirillum operosum]|uniref:NnrS family protein n=2 Tax=Natronospirillum operosum TaxID=2759953 RepID=A0A4Z0WI29_9GAMM|nr:NnrS family protein [Natronospirillum operosum]
MLDDLQQAPYRPFFLLAGAAALAGGLLWWWPWGSPLLLHLHLLLFGMASAAMAGYLLTALPSWTGWQDCPPVLLWALVGLWCLDRIVVLLPEPPLFILLTPGLAFHGLLTLFLLRRLWQARIWRPVWLALAPLGPGMAECWLLLNWHNTGWIGDAGEWAALFLALLLILVGGRAVPAFTRTGLQHLGHPDRIIAPDWLQRLSVGLMGIVLLMQGLGWPAHWTGSLLLATGLLQMLRWVGWTPWRIGRAPALWMLHAAWLWLATGLALLGLTRLGWLDLPPGTVLHALTMGAIGGMCLGIMLRAAMKRTPRGLQPSILQLLAAALVLLSPLPRLLPAPWFESGLVTNSLLLAATLWSAGWLLYLMALWPALRGPVPRPVLSGPRSTA